LNSRLDTVQAAILLEKIKIFSHELNLRQRVAARYGEGLDKFCKVPNLPADVTSSWAQYTLRLDSRDRIQSQLKLAGIPSVIYYPIPLSRQTGYAQYPQVSSKTRVSDALSLSVLSLPMHPYLEGPTQDTIIETLVKILEDESKS